MYTTVYIHVINEVLLNCKFVTGWFVNVLYRTRVMDALMVFSVLKILDFGSGDLRFRLRADNDIDNL